MKTKATLKSTVRFYSKLKIVAGLIGLLSVVSCSSIAKHTKGSSVGLSWSALEAGGPHVNLTAGAYRPSIHSNNVKINRAELKRNPQGLAGVSSRKLGSGDSRNLVRELRAGRELSQLPGFDLFEDGVISKQGRVKVYLGPTATLPTRRQVYWLMVKLLSKEYGCFIMAKSKQANTTAFRCRDQRRILLTSRRYDEWTEVKGRQYDARGYEIAVQNRSIIRIGSRRSAVENLF